MAAQGEIEASEVIAGQRVGSELEDDGGGVVQLLHAAQHRHEDLVEVKVGFYFLKHFIF